MERGREAKQFSSQKFIMAENSSWKSQSSPTISLSSKERSLSLFEEFNPQGTWNDTAFSNRLQGANISKVAIQCKKRLCETKEPCAEGTGVLTSRLNLQQVSWTTIGTQFIYESTQISLKSVDRLRWALGFCFSASTDWWKCCIMRAYKTKWLFFFLFKRVSLEEYVGQKLKDLCIVALYPHT